MQFRSCIFHLGSMFLFSILAVCPLQHCTTLKASSIIYFAFFGLVGMACCTSCVNILLGLELNLANRRFSISSINWLLEPVLLTPFGFLLFLHFLVLCLIQRCIDEVQDRNARHFAMIFMKFQICSIPKYSWNYFFDLYGLELFVGLLTALFCYF